MRFELSVHKTLEILSKIKIPYLTIAGAFVSSFNLWFLSLYFFNKSLLINHGLIITLLVVLALATTWCLIVGITVMKYFILYAIDTMPEELDSFNSEESKPTITLFVFLEIILLHAFFLYLEYLFRWDYVVILTVQFSVAFLIYLLIDYSVKKAYKRLLSEANK